MRNPTLTRCPQTMHTVRASGARLVVIKTLAYQRGYHVEEGVSVRIECSDSQFTRLERDAKQEVAQLCTSN